LFHTSVRQVKHPAPGLRYMVAGADLCIAPILATPCLAASQLVSSYLQTVNQLSSASHSYPALEYVHVVLVGNLENRLLSFTHQHFTQTNESRLFRRRFWKLVPSGFRRRVVRYKFTSFFFSKRLTASKTEKNDGASHRRRRWAWNVSYSDV